MWCRRTRHVRALVCPKERMSTRFFDDGRLIYDFGEPFVVRCPRCARRAVVARLDVAKLNKIDMGENSESAAYPLMDALFAPRRLVCAHCGHTRDWPHPQRPAPRLTQAPLRPTGPAVSIGGPYDWYFRLPLWLQTPCCGHVLWACNADHLDYLYRFVTADLRAGNPHRNKSLASRLPDWMKSAKNRIPVTHGLQRLGELVDRE
jgi:hypothetical protein